MHASRRVASWAREALHAALLVLVIYTMTSEVLGAEMCTKVVPVQQKPTKKVHVLRRVPASCSNWEKAWSWITKKDCGTKYRLDLVDVPSKSVTYKMVKVCCKDDIKCKEAQADGLEGSSGLNVSDEKFLAIVLGSTAAALLVLILVISISLGRKKKQCTLLCEERRHIYANTEDADESSELQGQKGCDDEGDDKVCESEYAEINDSGLPRYADIFKEVASAGGGGDGAGGEGHELHDPFIRATAPPIAAYESRTAADSATSAATADGEDAGVVAGAAGVGGACGGGGSCVGATCDPDESSNVQEVLQGTADILERESKQHQQHQQQPQQTRKQRRRKRDSKDGGEPGVEDASYYNVATPTAASAKGQGQGQGQKKRSGSGSEVREDAVMSLTKDDPAVMSGARAGESNPSSSSYPASNSYNTYTNCPTANPSNNAATATVASTTSAVVVDNSSSPPTSRCEVHAEEDYKESALSEQTACKTTCGYAAPSGSSVYEKLARPGDKDAHEYQRLLSRKDNNADDSDANEICCEENSEDVAFVDGGGDDDDDDDDGSVITNGYSEPPEPVDVHC